MRADTLIFGFEDVKVCRILLHIIQELITMINKISTEKAPKAIGPYSQAIMVNNVIYTSGQIPIDPETGNVKGSEIKEQAEQVMKNLLAVLQAANADFNNVVKTTCFLADIADFAAFNEVYAKYITSAPARSCVAVKDLPKGVLVEVEAIAYI